MDINNLVIVDWLVAWYAKLPERKMLDVTTIVLHATEIPGLKDAWDFAMRSADNEDGVGVCGHLYVDRDGTCYRFVPLDRIANHTKGYNSTSIGIELVNAGRHPAHFDTRYQRPSEPFPKPQVAALERLLIELRALCPNLVKIVRHSDIDRRLVPSSNDRTRWVQRRIDPGPQFPWKEVKSFWDQNAALKRFDRRPKLEP